MLSVRQSWSRIRVRDRDVIRGRKLELEMEKPRFDKLF